MRIAIFLIWTLLCGSLWSMQVPSQEKKDRLLWQWKAPGKVGNSLALWEDRIYLTCEKLLYCLDAASGKEIWKRRINWLTYSSLSISDGKLFISAANGIYCYDAKTGKKIWKKKTGSMVGDVTIVKDRLYFWSGRGGLFAFGQSRGVIFCVRKDSGKVIWKNTGCGGLHPPSRLIVINQRVYGVNTEGEVFCLDAKRGKKIWRKRVGTMTFSSVAADGKRVFARFSMDVSISCLDAKNGKRIWRWRSTTPKLGEGSSLIYHDGRIYFGENDGRVYCLDAKKGKVMWRFDTGSRLYFGPHHDPVIEGDRVYFTHISGQAFCVSAKDGRLIWRWKIPKKIRSIIGVGLSPPVVSKGRVFFVIKNVLYALRDDG